MEKETNKKVIILSMITITLLLVSVIGATFAYFTAQIGSAKTISARLQSGTTDMLYFTEGTPITLNASLENFGQGMDDIYGETITKAMLVANNTTNTATMGYDVILEIEQNQIVYTKPLGITGNKNTISTLENNASQNDLYLSSNDVLILPNKLATEYNFDTNSPELVLKVTNPNGNPVTSLPMDPTEPTDILKYVDKNYFDITQRTGSFLIAKNYQITGNPTKIDEWKFEVRFLNRDYDQSNNMGKTFSARVILKKHEYKEPKINITQIANDNTSIVIEMQDIEFNSYYIDYDYITNNTNNTFYLMCSKDNGVIYENCFENDSVYNFNNLTAGQTYPVKIKMVDDDRGEEYIVYSEILTPKTPFSLSVCAGQNINTCLINNNLVQENSTPNFNKVAITNQSGLGLFAMEDDYGTSYYYRGAVSNNWVKFAGFYWRIIRINGEGSVRMIYQGETAPTSAESVVYTGTDYISISEFNTHSRDNAYVGYMYGTPGSSTYATTHVNTNNSTIKTVIDAWYKTNIEDKGYGSNVADVVYCNDRSLSSGTGTGTTNTNYGAYNRLYTNKTPTLKCTQKNDAFTVSDTSKGNGKLTYPVGLITADEVSIAGGVFITDNSNYYLKSNNYFWAASARYSSSSYADVFDVDSDGGLGSCHVDITAGAVRPVISLTADYFGRLKGSGTYNSPFTE